MRHARRGFSRADLAALIVALFVLGSATLVPAVGEAKRLGRLQLCEDRLMERGLAEYNFVSDNRDALPSFRWRAGRAGLNATGKGQPRTDLEAVQQEALELMRKVTGHPEIPAADASWVPQLRYTWLILRDGGYISASRKLVCPADENLGRLRDQFMDGGKQGDPWLQRVYPNGQVDTSLAAYASTYELVPAAWSPYGGTKVAEGWMPTVEQGNTEVEFLVPDTFPFGRTTVMLYDVVTPEHKVWMYDPIGRHNAGARRSYADRRSKQPLLMFDASCRIKSPAEANPGCSPNAPDSSVPCTFRGTEGDSRWTDGSEGKRLTGYFRWTRQGLRGVDIEGAEPKALVPQARKAIGDTFVRATALPATR